MKTILTPDILAKIYADFSKQEVEEAIAIAVDLFDNCSQVGPAQLVRSLLYLINGDLSAFKARRKKLEPRDDVSEAEDMAGNLGHYFIPTFDEIEKGTWSIE
jgi:hypothetical protein